MHLYTEWMYKSHVEDKNMQAVCCKQFLKDKWNFFKITKNSNGKRQLTRTKHCCGSMQTKLVKSFTLQQQQHTIWAFKKKKDPADRWGKLLSWCCQGCWIDAMNLKSLRLPYELPQQHSLGPLSQRQLWRTATTHSERKKDGGWGKSACGGQRRMHFAWNIAVMSLLLFVIPQLFWRYGKLLFHYCLKTVNVIINLYTTSSVIHSR